MMPVVSPLSSPMKSNNLFHRIYEHSFSLFLTFSFYALIFVVLLSFEEEKAFSEGQWSESQYVSTEDRTPYVEDHEQKIGTNQYFFVEKMDSLEHHFVENLPYGLSRK